MRLIILALCLTAAACTTPPKVEAEATDQIRYLALGDSYTIGEGVPEGARYPVVLAERLRGEGVSMAEPEIIARTGWTTDELDSAIDVRAPGSDHGLVTLLIGVNNQYRGRPVEGFQAEFVGLLRRAVGFAGGDARKVVVLSIPDWGVTPFAAGAPGERIAAEIDAYNAVVKAETQRLGAHFVDVTPLSRRASQEPELVAGDGLHPSGQMYRGWVELALPQVRAALGKER